MSLIDGLTPKDTEEIKPGLFVQKKKNGYRAVNPIAWNGKYRWRKQFGWRTVFTIAIICFIAFTYFNETSYCRQLQENPCELLPNITDYCYGKEIDQRVINQLIIEGINGTRNTTTIQNNP